MSGRIGQLSMKLLQKINYKVKNYEGKIRDIKEKKLLS